MITKPNFHKCLFNTNRIKYLGKLKLIDGLFDQGVFENRRAKKSVRSGATELFFGEVYF